jgi:hypothetical protein
MKVTEEQVGPDKAAKWLEGNTDNRPLSQVRVNRYAADMKAGLWLLIHQPVAFDSEGRILDGQHRLWAVVESGVTVPLMVARDADPDTFTLIDQQKPRSASDSLAIAGYEQAYNLPGMLKIVRLYDEFRDEAWTTARAQITNDDALILAQKAGQAAVDAVTLARSIRQVSRTGPLPAYGAAIYLIHRETGLTGQDQNTMFWDPYATGVGLGHGDPRLALKRTIDRIYVARQGAGPALTRPFLGLMLKAWNAHANGKSVQVLSFKESERVPDVSRRRRKH